MISLVEYGKEELLRKESYSEEDKVLLNKLQFEDIKSGSRRFDIREDKEGIYIKPYNHIGTIQLSKERINIYPRFDNTFNKVLFMMLFAKNLNYKEFSNDLEVESGQYNLYEFILLNLIKETKKILSRGIFREYVEQSENLNVLRGRIDFNNHIRKNSYNSDSIYCRYDELIPDIVENSVILKALRIGRAITSNKNIKKELKKYEEAFKEICTEYRGNKMPQFRYHRLNSIYKEAHDYCKILIEDLGIEDIYSKGKEHCKYSLLIDMNELFEAFVARLCEKYLKDTHKVVSQKVITKAILNSNNKCYRKIIPDIVLQDKATGEYTIIDTKNKNYGENKVSNEDIYQLTFYGMYFSNIFKDKVNIMIIYPIYEKSENKEEDIYIQSLDEFENKIAIKAKGIDINECIDYLLNT